MKLLPNHSCKVKQVTKFKYIFLGLQRDDVTYLIAAKYHISKNSGYYIKTYLYYEDGYLILFARRGHNPRIFAEVINFSLSKINNLNSHQRRVYKKLSQQIKDFRNSEFSCDGCKYKNEYLLTKKCIKTYVKI